MDEHKSVTFARLLSEESSCSALSEEVCGYYQAEILEQLPSVQAARPRGTGPSDWRDSEPTDSVLHGGPSNGTRDKASSKPLRELAISIRGKREIREQRKLQTRNIGFWESWRRSQSINNKRLRGHVRVAVSKLSPWQHILHTVESRFGVGVKAYFLFLRYLVYLNILHCVFVLSFILGPTVFYGRGNNTDPLIFGGNDSVLDFFLGTGFLERSPVFYGFYTRGSLNWPCFNTPILFFTGILTILIVSVIMVVRRMVVGYKHSWLLGNRYNVNVSFKIFCGWDFTVQGPASACLNHGFIRNDLKLHLEEQRFHLREAQRTLAQWIRLYLLRIFLNFLVLTLLGAAFCLIFYATTLESESQNSLHHWLNRIFLQYLPPIVITLVNLILPHIFRKISSFEDYSLTTQVNTTLVRSIFLKLASLGIFLFFLFRQPISPSCWEHRFGREMYKLFVFDFLACFCNTLLFAYPRILLKEKCPSCRLARWSGQQHFLIPFNVLDLVYKQTVSWAGLYYCPLLPFLGTVTLVATFYIKKFNVLRCCVPEQRIFRASSSSVLFHLMLLLGLFMAATALAIHLYMSSTSSSGPFGSASVFNVTSVCLDSLPMLAQNALRYMSSEGFALPLILSEIVILTSYVSRGRANQRAIERLKDMLVISTSDKRFLVKQHATLLRKQSKRKRADTAGTGPDQPSDQFVDPMQSPPRA